MHTKVVRSPEEADGIAAAKAKNSKDEDYLKPKDGAYWGAWNPNYHASPPMRVSLGNNSGKPQRDEIPSEMNLDAYLKGAKPQVHASNVSHPKKFKRQRSGEKASVSEEIRSLNRARDRLLLKLHFPAMLR